MNDTISILAYFKRYMRQENLNLTTFARMAGINAGTLSSIINNNKALTVDHLDRLTAVMNLPAGNFYEQYIQEYLTILTPNWRRFKPFIYRCADCTGSNVFRMSFICYWKISCILLSYLKLPRISFFKVNMRWQPYYLKT
ncbi:helix-turn-helix domain-containing protein [Paenibacillus lentus]|uniref:helix-turn-helix domain-containing protein n=1 Tax=Paenibacillus lentus TaxID=1338368 RepID=UPI0036668B71